mgnify:FL=1
MSGTGVYSHLKELRQGDFIEYQSARRLKVYSTTAKFKKYFGIDGDTETLKSKLFSRMRQSKTKEKLRNENQNHRIVLFHVYIIFSTFITMYILKQTRIIFLLNLRNFLYVK